MLDFEIIVVGIGIFFNCTSSGPEEYLSVYLDFLHSQISYGLPQVDAIPVCAKQSYDGIACMPAAWT